MSSGRSLTRRPNNAFMCFLQKYREEWQVGRISQKELVKKAGDIWQKMTDEQKCPYVHAANENQEVEKAIELIPTSN